MQRKSKRKGRAPIRPILIDSYEPSLPLPPEILELVFWHLDERSFFIALLTCKQFWVVGSSRRNLLRQILRIPGLRQGLKDLPARPLFQEFRRRALAAAFGANLWADVRGCQLPKGFSPSQSAFTTLCTSASPPHRSALVACPNRNGTIDVYHILLDDIRLIKTLSLQDFSTPSHPREFHALAFSHLGDLAILYGNHKDAYEVAIYHRKGDLHNPDLVLSSASPPPVFDTCAKRPTSIAIGESGTICINWSVPRIPERSQVTYVTPQLSEDDGLCTYKDPWVRKNFVVNPHARKPGWVSSMSFVNNELAIACYEQGSPCPVGISNLPIADEDDTIRCVDTMRMMNVDHDYANQWIYVGLPFYGSHCASTNTSDEKVCIKTYLAIGFNGLPLLDDNRSHLFVIRCWREDPPASCDHAINLNYTMRHYSYEVAALLVGWQPMPSSLGTPWAASPDGHRIVMALWDVVLCWTLDPKWLCQGHMESYFPRRDFHRGRDFGRIRPEKLPSQGVVHKLYWMDRDNLFAVTDRGLVHWCIGVRGRGKRDFEFDAVPSSPAAAPSQKRQRLGPLRGRLRNGQGSIA